MKDCLAQHAVRPSCYRILGAEWELGCEFHSKFTEGTHMMQACKTDFYWLQCVSVRLYMERGRAEEFVDPGVCRCREPADWSLDSCHHFQKRLFAATGKQKEGFISQHVSIFLQQSVCVSLKGACWRVFRLQNLAAYFQLPIFSSVTLVVDMEDGG